MCLVDVTRVGRKLYSVEAILLPASYICMQIIPMDIFSAYELSFWAHIGVNGDWMAKFLTKLLISAST